jgi:hypothetical protein
LELGSLQTHAPAEAHWLQLVALDVALKAAPSAAQLASRLVQGQQQGGGVGAWFDPRSGRAVAREIRA